MLGYVPEPVSKIEVAGVGVGVGVGVDPELLKLYSALSAELPLLSVEFITK